jgi:hypothetical protein
MIPESVSELHDTHSELFRLLLQASEEKIKPKQRLYCQNQSCTTKTFVNSRYQAASHCLALPKFCFKANCDVGGQKP